MKAAHTPFHISVIGALLCLPFLVPLHVLPMPSFYSEALAFGLGLIALMFALGGPTQGSIRIPPEITALLALTVVVVMQALRGQIAYAETAASLAMYLCWTAAIMVMAARYSQPDCASERELRQQVICEWSRWLLAGGLLTALIGWLQILAPLSGIHGWIAIQPNPHMGVWGNLAQQNHYATYLAIAIAAALHLHLQQAIKTRLLWPILAVLGSAMLISGSRSLYLYLPWLGWTYASPFLKSFTRRQWHIGLAGLGIFVLMAMLALQLDTPPTQALAARLGHVGSALQPRFFLWRHAWQMFLDHPVLGVGFDHFAINLIEQFRPDLDLHFRGVDQYAHNLFIHLLAVSGLVGLLAFALPFLSASVRTWRAQLTSDRMWYRAILGVLAIHSQLEQPWAYAYFLGIAGVVIGSSSKVIIYQVPVLTLVRRLAQCLVLACGVLLIRTYNEFSRMHRVFFVEQTMPESLRRQVAEDLHASPVWRPMAELIAPTQFLPDQPTMAQQLAFSTRLIEHTPVPEALFRHAVLLAQAGQIDQAASMWTEAWLAYPHDAGTYADRLNQAALSDQRLRVLAQYASGLQRF